MVADGFEGTLNLVFNVFDVGWPMEDRVLISPFGYILGVTVVGRSGLSFLDLVQVEMLCGLVVVDDDSRLWMLDKDGDVAVVDGGWLFDVVNCGGSLGESAMARVSFTWAWVLVSNYGLSLVYWAWAVFFYFFFCYLSVLIDGEVSTSLFI